MTLTNDIRNCLSADKATPGCFYDFFGKIKWYIVKWILTWPFSLAYTLSRDPLKIATDTIVRLSEQRYIAIIQSALFALDHQPGTNGIETANWTTLAWFFGSIAGYLLMGTCGPMSNCT